MRVKSPLLLEDAIKQLSDVRQEIRSKFREGRFSIHARLSGFLCICGEPIEIGDEITRSYYLGRWIHLKCDDLDTSDEKPASKSSLLLDKIVTQALEKNAVWRDDLLDLAKTTYLGKWGVDYWTEDQELVKSILDYFGLHRLTTGWRCSTDKARQKYAQKIEKEYARHKGWICRLCKRLIWVEKSVERSLGPVCYGHLKTQGIVS